MADAPGTRIDVTLVAGGMYHDIDYARLQLLGLLQLNKRHYGDIKWAKDTEHA